jgi:hypothetical protein
LGLYPSSQHHGEFAVIKSHTAIAAKEPTKVIIWLCRPNDRSGEFGSSAGGYRTTACDVGSWSMAGAHFNEMIAAKPPDDSQLPTSAIEMTGDKSSRSKSRCFTGDADTIHLPRF